MHTTRWTLATVIMMAATRAIAQPSPATLAATQPATQDQIAAAIDKLSSSEFADRVAAHHWLHDHLDEAEPAIRKMVASTQDAESKKRGQQLIEEATWGFDVDVPQGLRDSVKAMSKGDATDEGHANVIQQLGEAPAAWGSRVALRLMQSDVTDHEREELAEIVSNGISPLVERAFSRGTLPELLRQLQDDKIQDLLRQAAAIRLQMRDPAMSPQAAAAADARLPAESRFFAARARGDLQTALTIVRDGTYPDFEIPLLVEMGRWSDVVKAMENDEAAQSPASLALAKTFAAGGLMPESAAAKLKAAPAEGDGPPNRTTDIIALVVGGRPDDALELARQSNDTIGTAQLMIWRNKLPDARALVEDAMKQKKEGATFAALVVGRMYWDRGAEKESEALFAAVEKATPLDAEAIGELYSIRVAQKKPAEAKAILFRALEHCRPDQFVDLIVNAYPAWDSERYADARLWWFTLEASQPDLSLADRLALVEKIVTNKLSAREFSDLVDDARQYVGSIRGAEFWDQQELADRNARRLAAITGEKPNVDPAEQARLMHNATWDAMESKAAELTDNADREKVVAYFADLLTRPGMAQDRQPLRYMHGWARMRAGHADGAVEMRSAQICMAASWNEHHDTMQMLMFFGDREGALAEQKRVVNFGSERYGWFGPYGTLALMLRSGHDMETVEPYWISVWDTVHDRREPVRVRSYVRYSEDAGAQQAVLARRLIAAGKVDQGLALARQLHDHWDVQEDAWIALCSAVADAGKKAESHELLQQMLDVELKELKEYPDSSAAHNNLAWILARSRQDLDTALTHAQRAVALRPDTAGGWDTLAEVYWARGDREKAVSIEQKAYAMEPKDHTFKHRIEHFQKDAPGSLDVLDN